MLEDLNEERKQSSEDLISGHLHRLTLRTEINGPHRFLPRDLVWSVSSTQRKLHSQSSEPILLETIKCHVIVSWLEQIWGLHDAELLWRLIRKVTYLSVNFNGREEILYGLRWVPTAATTAQFNVLGRKSG